MEYSESAKQRDATAAKWFARGALEAMQIDQGTPHYNTWVNAFVTYFVDNAFDMNHAWRSYLNEIRNLDDDALRQEVWEDFLQTLTEL